jgi:uncharacterized short protein YbdD (DUF466 family)
MKNWLAVKRAEVLAARVRKSIRHLRAAYHQVFGVPDYQAYLQHMRARHPGAPCLSEREFVAHWLDHKYGRKGPRCC